MLLAVGFSCSWGCSVFSQEVEKTGLTIWGIFLNLYKYSAWRIDIRKEIDCFYISMGLIACSFLVSTNIV